MRTIKLKQMILKNFMGIKEYTFKPNGQGVKVLGENETGKTTLFSAFTFLIIGEDSHGNHQFDILPINKKGDPANPTKATVKATIEVDGDEIELEKSYKEKTKEPRGQSNKVISGHTKDYKWNGVPVQQSEFNEKLEDLINLDKLKLLLAPHKFNELHWKERRSVLMDMVEGINDEDIINDNEDLSELELDGKDPEDYRKQLRSEAKETKEELDEIPTRIDELERDKPEIDGDREEIEDELTDLKQRKKDLEEVITDLKSESGGELRKKKAKIEDQMREIKREYQQGLEDDRQDLKDKKNELIDEKNRLSGDIAERKSKLKELKDEKERLERKRERLSDEWDEFEDERVELKNQTFDDDKKECPTCGQELPEEQIEEKRKEFNKWKAHELEGVRERKKQIEEKGKEVKADLEETNSEIPDVESKIETLRNKKETVESKIETLEKQINELPDEDSYKEKDAYKELVENKKAIQEQIKTKDNSGELKKKKEQLESVNNKISSCESKLATLKTIERTQARVEELMAKEDELAALYEEKQKQLRLLDKFIETKVNLLENSINDKFQVVSFKLFEKQVNGKIKQTCESLVKNISWDSTLNTGSKVIGGLDIINTLSREFEMSSVCFVDNAESTTDFNEKVEKFGEIEQIIQLRAEEGIEELEIQEV